MNPDSTQAKAQKDSSKLALLHLLKIVQRHIHPQSGTFHLELEATEDLGVCNLCQAKLTYSVAPFVGQVLQEFSDIGQFACPSATMTPVVLVSSIQFSSPGLSASLSSGTGVLGSGSVTSVSCVTSSGTVISSFRTGLFPSGSAWKCCPFRECGSELQALAQHLTGASFRHQAAAFKQNELLLMSS